MSERIKVETYKVGADKTAPAERVSPAPVRSVRGQRGSTAAKKAARDAHEKIGYEVRSISFAEMGLIVYVNGEPKEEFSSAKSGPRGGSKTKRATKRRRRKPAE